MSTPHPGTVSADEQAFQQISARFQDEVGRIISSVDFVHGPVPFWALMRVMFPIAESLGDLIYQADDASAQNLCSVLKNEFESVRTGYAPKAAILTLLYRHSLTHHDELRTIVSGGKEVGWMVNGAKDTNHLSVRVIPAGAYVIEFQPRAFYSDIVDVCTQAAERSWEGRVMARYNSWMRLDLGSVKRNSTVKAAEAELAFL
jgi:hypothetical protein